MLNRFFQLEVILLHLEIKGAPVMIFPDRNGEFVLVPVLPGSRRR